ncbi:hypothetical protein COCC4DRAFT_31162 [Bipolaris maydis ATCC 48331]|uniref:Uncharacterized protein n=1 Tax=Cochliobolus heterostrophus (strain C4 / ATCC 48331 / race T) TaxID=665024 RepID=N4XEX2_COCH4|nr:uncharacterized protein COCC4DRAFT_31162 [Bipolaris maydis ATCC 48331]ENI07058.1 hypothetical protein COCC4DRAFT_31162 [Bipolaris maydis ATCC 48331]
MQASLLRHYPYLWLHGHTGLNGHHPHRLNNFISQHLVVHPGYLLRGDRK